MKLNKLLIGLFLVSSISLCSCAKDTKHIEDVDYSQLQYDGSKVDIVFYETMGHSLEEILAEYIQDFNVTYPNINIKYKMIGGYNDMRDQLETKLAHDTDCTMTFCYPDHVALYNKTKKVVKLDSLMNNEYIGFSQEEMDDFVKAYLDEGKQFGDGLTYCLPFAKSTEVLYYDKTFFAEHNLEVPTTWDEMWERCAEIKAIDPDCVPLGYDSESNLFITLCQQMKAPFTSNEAPYFLFDTDQTRQILQTLKTQYDKGYMTTKKLYGAYTSGLFTARPDSKGVQHRCYMCVGSSAGASYQAASQGEFETGITCIPQIDKQNNPAVISQGPSVCLFKNDNPQVVAASFLFLKYLLTNKGFQAEYSMTSGYVPVIESVFDYDVYKSFLEKGNGYDNLQALSVKQSVEQRSYYFSSPVFVGSSVARDQSAQLITGYISGKSADEVISAALQECRYEAGL